MASFDANDDRAQDADRTILLLDMNKTPATPAAVINMTCRLPGAIGSPDRLWEALLRDDEGDDPVTDIPPDRCDADRLLLETSPEAMKHTGLTPKRAAASPTGVLVGATVGSANWSSRLL